MNLREPIFEAQITKLAEALQNPIRYDMKGHATTNNRDSTQLAGNSQIQDSSKGTSYG